MKYVQKKKKNEKLFCCNIELNTDIKNINNICVIKYDSTDKEQILFLNNKEPIKIPKEIEDELDEFVTQKNIFSQYKDNSSALSLFLTKNKIKQIEMKSKEFENAENTFKSIKF